MIENYLVRRFICNRRSSDLNKIFPQLYRQALGQNLEDRVDGIRKALATRGYPSDREFYESLLTSRLYGTGEKQQKAKFVLDTIECAYGHKEPVELEDLTIEHVMPQTITDWWKEHLGEDWETDHEVLLHTLGNLTLTGYNSELSNSSFPQKCNWFASSHLQLNLYFSTTMTWRKADIEKRGEMLAQACLDIWNSFGDRKADERNANSVRGRTPTTVYVLGVSSIVDSWVKVYTTTLDRIAYLEPDKFDELAIKHPNLISSEPRFRRNRQLGNGYYVELNRSAEDIYRFCRYVMDFVGLSDEDWKVDVE
ncbi:MAG: HNH endonuclease family protein [Anaerolineae bacterium]|nr:HNH endonuclease family protein [Anaerolineae bacterium]NUQ05546.1 HNH endonuclease [Anaerolineae bacterium]